MDKQQYKQIQRGVAAFIGIIVAISAVMRTYEIALIGVLLGILVMYIAGKRLNEIIRDERNALIQQKASTLTLSLTTIGLAFSGIAITEFSYRGFESIRGYGYFMVYLAMAIMIINNLFSWYYGLQMGD